MMRQEQMAPREMETQIRGVPTKATMRSSDDALVQVLESLADEIGGLRVLVVGDRSGLPIVSTFRGRASMTMTAMATLAMSAATKVTSSLNLPEPDDILIEAGGWRVLVQLLGNGFTLTCVLPADEDLGLVKLAMQARGREIREIIDDNADKLRKEAAALPKKIAALDLRIEELAGQVRDGLLRLPNLLHESVPIGKDDSENVEVSRWGTPRTVDFELRPHGELLEALRLADFERARKIAGAGFVYLLGDLVRLDQALLSFALEYMVRQGFTAVFPPFLMRRAA